MSNLSYLQPLPSQAVAQETQEESYYPMLQGKGTNGIRFSSGKNVRVNNNGDATYEKNGFRMLLKGYSKLTPGAKKLFDLGCIHLTDINTYRPKKGQLINNLVFIPLEEYGRLRGYELTPRETTTEEEQAAEQNRITNTMHEMRKRIKQELFALANLTPSWEEPRKRDGEYGIMNVIQSGKIRNGYIEIRFSDELVDYLVNAYIMPYPKAMQALDERNSRTYNVGYKLALHHNMDNNRTKGTSNIISVKALIEACDDIPTYEEVQASKDRGHWERRIKDPLTAALDSNVATGVISSWEYSNSKGTPLDDNQVSIPDYQTFIGLYVHYEMKEVPDQSERLQRKAERKEATKKRKTSKGGGE